MKNLTDVDTFSANVACPEDGDARNAASVESGFQALANRTRNAKNRLDALTATTTNVVRVINIFKAQLQASATQTWLTNSNGASGIESRDNSVYMRIPLDEYLVDGATLGSVTVDVDPGTGEATVGNRMAAFVQRRTVGTTPAVTTLGASNTADATGNDQTITLTTNSNNVIDKSTYSYHLHISASASGGTSPYDKVLGAKLIMSSVPGLPALP